MENINAIKKELCDYIDSLNITYELYDILENMYSNFDDRLFVKIIEEVYNGNISFYDFKRIFNNDSFLEDSLNNQEKLYREHKLMRERLEALDVELGKSNNASSYSVSKLTDFSYLNNNNFSGLMSTYEHYAYESVSAIDEPTFNSGTYYEYDAINQKYIKSTEYSASKTYYKQYADYSAADIEKQNILLHRLMQETDDPMLELYRSRMLKELLSTDDIHRNKFIDSMLLSVHDFIVPVDYNKVLLNSSDLKFSEENKIDLEEMKKIKSFAAFLSTYYQE